MPLDTNPTNALTFSVLGSLSTPLAGGGAGGAEISGFDPASKRLFTTSNEGLRIIDLSNPAAPALLSTFKPVDAGAVSNDVSSVAVKGGVVAMSLLNANKELPGDVVFLNAATGAFLGKVQVGNHPDMVTFTPDGSKLLVANEGEWLNNNGGPGNTPGSVSIIDLSGGVAAATVATAGFGGFDAAALRAEGVRVALGQTASNDLEPEYIAVSHDGTKAMVTLQEANAVGILDIATATFTDIVPLGTKNFSTLLADFSDQDGPGGTNFINLKTGQPVFGLYMPDAIDSYQAGGQTYYVIANEGDDRNDFVNPDEVIRMGTSTVPGDSYDLDDATFPNEATLTANANLGRLNVVNTPGLRGDTDGDGDIDQILTLGARSFSILDAAGNMVFDSADIIERIVSAQGAPRFDDTRSDNKGPEPEGVEIASIGGRTYAFIGLERSRESLVFDVTDPTNVTYTGSAYRDGDLNPEGTLFIAAADSPTGKALYVQTSEESNTVTIFTVKQAPAYTLQLLHYYGESGLLGTETAPIMGALIDKFDDQYANTLVLGEGDSYIPGPWLIGGADPSLSAVPGIGATALGRPDIAIMNAFGTDASALGNHEFDLGSPVLQGAIQNSGAWVGAQFPLLTANLDFSAEITTALRGIVDTSLGGTGGSFAGQETTAIKGKIAPYAVSTQGGEKIGLIGITTFDLLIKSSPNGTKPKDDGNPATDDIQEVAIYVQNAVTALQAMGVNKIVMLDQLDTIERNKALAPLVSGIDVMVAGGGHERMGDATDTAVGFNGHTADFIPDAYPIVATGADGKKTLIVTTDTEYTYLGRLVVDFDANGEIILPNLDPAINGAYASTEATLQKAYGTTDSAATIVAGSTIGSKVDAIVDAIDAVITAKDGTIWGYTNVYLEGDRAFGRAQEVNLGDLASDSVAFKAQQALGAGSFVVGLTNGGGIRASIGSIDEDGGKIAPIANPDVGKAAGAISTLDIENALRFDNRLVVFDMTPEGLKAILEFTAGLSPNAVTQSGGFAQWGGMRVSFDPTDALGSRVKSVALLDFDGHVIARVIEDGQVLPDAPATISMVTGNFTADGGDGYPIKANASNFRYLLADGTLSAAVDESILLNSAAGFTAAGVTSAQVLGQQQAFKDYLQAFHATPGTAYDQADVPVGQDQRVQNLDLKPADTVFVGETLTGTVASEVLDGFAGDDQIAAGNGNDSLGGGIGDDTLKGEVGNDDLFGGAGADDLSGGAGADDLDGGTGADSLLGGGGADNLYGGEGADRLIGGAGADNLYGGLGNDYLVSGVGADNLRGDLGDDLLVGGADADRFIFDGAAGFDRIVDFVAGEDLIVLEGLGFTDFAGVQAAMRQVVVGVRLTLDGDSSVLIRGVTLAGLDAGDFVLL